MSRRSMLACGAALVLAVFSTSAAAALADADDPLALALRRRVAVADGSYGLTEQPVRWDPARTALIICDAWDAHHSLNATERVGELAPRIDALADALRESGALIVHAPSSCIAFYENHPARVRAQQAPRAEVLPEGIDSWQLWLDEDEESVGYPIDHADGGVDDDPAEGAAWHAELRGRGRNSGAPWVRQHEAIRIDAERDAISDSGAEIWSLLRARNIDHVLIAGVHVNMCVLGRPFGLRQMVRCGRDVALVRDLTDSMYDPADEPRVDHFTGTDLVVEHIERHVCPTVSSDQILGGAPFRFAGDARPHVVMLLAEREYKTEITLPAFAERYLRPHCALRYVYAPPESGRNDLAGIGALREADLAVVSVRRRAPKAAVLEVVREYVASGRPLVGIRTASHAFSLRGEIPPPGHAIWEEFDGTVFGGSYSGHHSNHSAAKRTKVQRAANVDSAIIDGLASDERSFTSSLYQVLPLAEGAQVLAWGRVPGVDERQPVAWTFHRSDGGPSFYTSLGHPADFADPWFQELLARGVEWAFSRSLPRPSRQAKPAGEQQSPPNPATAGGPDADDREPPLPVNEGRDSPLDPDQSRTYFDLDDDLELDVLLSEPLITQPLHLSFDARGRLWLVEYRQYPDPAGLRPLSRDGVWRVAYDRLPPPPPHEVGSPFRGADRISIHEDTDGDGLFDHHDVFADGLNLATSALPVSDGVWVTNPPYLLFFADRDHDDRPDGAPVVHLSGFQLEDTHSIANSLSFGPDGWLYGAQGSTVTGAVVAELAEPRPPPVRSLGQNIWRYHPTRHEFEIYAEGGGNAFGVEIDAQGRVFSGHNGGDTRGFHYVQGGGFWKNFGKHGQLANPFAFGYLAPMRHEAVERFTHQFLIYEETALPSRFHGRLVGVDPLHCNLVLSALTPDGSTLATRDIGRPFASRDRWVRPVHVTAGPDGALYVADWYDDQVNHYKNHEGQIDRDRGRVYRIRGRDAPRTPAPTLETAGVAAWIAALEDPRRWTRRTALRLLAERGGEEGRRLASRRFEEVRGPRALDLLQAAMLSDDFDDALGLAACERQEAEVRAWAVRRLGDLRRASDAVRAQLLALAEGDPSAAVRSQLACTARRLPTAACLELVDALARRDEDAEDPHLPLLIWWALESKAEDSGALLALFDDSSFWRAPIVAKHLVRRVARRFATRRRRTELRTLALLLERAPDDAARAELFAGIEEAFAGRVTGALPAELSAQLDRLGHVEPLVVALRRGRPDARAAALAKVTDPGTDPGLRVELIQALGEVGGDTVPARLTVLLGSSKEDTVTMALLAALGRFSDAAIAGEVIAAYPDLPVTVQGAARELLTSRAVWATALLDAIDSSRLASTELELGDVARLLALDDAQVTRRTLARFGRLQRAVADGGHAEMARIAEVLEVTDGSPVAGRELFRDRCVRCHQMYGEGGGIGPDLTSYQRSDVRALLLATVAPSAEIREGYASLAIKDRTGALRSGLLVDEDEEVLVLREASGLEHTVRKAEVERRRWLEQSLMPHGLLADLSDQQLRDLFAFLRSTTPPK